MEMAARPSLIRAYLQDYVRTNPVDDAELKKNTRPSKGRMGDKDYKPRHVLVETEDQAKAIIARLQGGTAFEGRQSRATRLQGAWWRNSAGATPAMYVKPFSDAMVQLQKGKYTTTPVKSDFLAIT